MKKDYYGGKIMGKRRRRGTEEPQARRTLFMEGSLEFELDEKHGYEPYDIKNKTTDNSRNGHSKWLSEPVCAR